MKVLRLIGTTRLLANLYLDSPIYPWEVIFTQEALKSETRFLLIIETCVLKAARSIQWMSSQAPMVITNHSIHRLANLKNGAYLLTTSQAELNYALSLGFWRYEGVAFESWNSALPIPFKINCNEAYSGQEHACELWGIRLPNAISIPSSTCSSGYMNEISGGTSIYRKFSCTSTNNAKFEPLLVSIPVHPIQFESRPYAWMLNSAIVTDFSCNATANKGYACQLRGTNLSNGIRILQGGCENGVMAESLGGTREYRLFRCALSSPVTNTIINALPFLSQTAAFPAERGGFIDWASGNPSIPSAAGDATNCGPWLNSAAIPTSTPAGEFRVAQSGCFATLKLAQPEWNNIINGNGFDFDVTKYSRRFADVFKDSFDFVLIMLDAPEKPVNFEYYGMYRSMNARLPSRTRRLLGTLILPSVGNASLEYGSTPLETGPLLHELMHEWENRGAIPSTEVSHWGFSSVGGQLGGWNSLQPVVSLGGNVWKAKGPAQTCLPAATPAQVIEFCAPRQSFGLVVNGGNSVGYSQVELMLMGLVPSSEVPSVLVALDGSLTTPSGSTKNYENGEFYASEWRTVSAASIVIALGANAPNITNSQKHFRIATIVLTARDQLDVGTVNLLNRSIAGFSKDGVANFGNWDPSYINLHNFFTATKGLAKMRAGQLMQEIR